MTEGPGAGSAACLLDLLAGRCRAQAVSTAAALGLADRLAAGPRTAEDLAREIEAQAPTLARLLDFLVGLGLCTRTPDGAYALTANGAALRSDALGPFAAFLGGPEFWDPWSRLRDVLREGGPGAYERAHGATLYADLAARPAAAQAYDAAIDAFTRTQAEALCGAVDLSAVRTLADIGGGRGTALVCVLARWPHLRGILFDLPHVVADAQPRLDAACPGRVEVRAGDFTERVPQGADAYLLKGILHNWDDAGAATLLRRCAEALPPGGRLLAIEPILAPDERMDAARMLDLEMLVLTGGRQRRKPELRRLFHGAGLTLDRVQPLVAGSWVLEASARG